MTESVMEGHALAIEDLTVTLPDGRQLFRKANLAVEPGEFVLLVGVSGSGKSTLLKLTAGLDDPDVAGPRADGQIRVLGIEPRQLAPGQVGLVFQSLALFDELSPVQNVQFAVDHRQSGGRRDAHATMTLLQRLRVPIRARLSQLSGGERQRVAVARTLALDPPILLFDEPTTGLDPERARAVAELIAETHGQFGKTVVVVTHHYEPFLRYRPRLVLVNTQNGLLQDIDEQQLRGHFDHPPREIAAQGAYERRGPAWTGHLLHWLEGPGRAMWTLAGAVGSALGGWQRPQWKLRYLWHYLRMVALGTTALYVAIAGIMLGFVFITFSFANLPYEHITVPLLTEEFLAGTGYSMYRVVVPLLIAVLIAGKCGASAAADLGARRLTQQFEAMRNLGAQPTRYLYGTLVIALAVAAPLLTFIGFAASCYAALVAFLMASPEATVAVFRRNFFATLLPAGQRFFSGTDWVLLKSATTGILIAALAYEIGSRPKLSSVEVSRDVGLTIFWASLAVLMLHALYSFVEF